MLIQNLAIILRIYVQILSVGEGWMLDRRGRKGWKLICVQNSEECTYRGAINWESKLRKNKVLTDI